MLLEAAERRGIRILPVILGHCLYAESPLGRFQAINAPDKPLEQLTKAGRDKALSDLARAIAAGLSGEAAGDAPVPTPTHPRTTSGATLQTKAPGGVQVHSPRGSPENGQSAPRSLGTWIAGGLLLAFLFVVVLVWWPSSLAPVGSGEVGTDRGSAAVGNGIANTGSQTIDGPVTITGGGSSPPGETLDKPGSASAGTGIANTGEQVIEGPVTIGTAPSKEKQ